MFFLSTQNTHAEVPTETDFLVSFFVPRSNMSKYHNVLKVAHTLLADETVDVKVNISMGIYGTTRRPELYMLQLTAN